MSSPLCFVLGFYVNIVIVRWWNQWNNIPWCDQLAHCIVAHIKGNDYRGRLIRRNLIRYVNLASLIVYRLISPPIAKRFPEFTDLVRDGFMSEEEYKMYTEIESKHWTYWVPFSWFVNLCKTCFDEGRIRTETGYRQLIDELNNYRAGLGTLVGYDWVNIPLVYTQVVTIAVHSYFMMSILAKQYLHPHSYLNEMHNSATHRITDQTDSPEYFFGKLNQIIEDEVEHRIRQKNDFVDSIGGNTTQANFEFLNQTTEALLESNLFQNNFSNPIKKSPKQQQVEFDQLLTNISVYIPIYMWLEFLFYMGWLKVAQQLINPFGSDDDDFEMHEIIDRNYEVSMRIVDDSSFSVPSLHQDVLFDTKDYDAQLFEKIFCNSTKSSSEEVLSKNSGSDFKTSRKKAKKRSVATGDHTEEMTRETLLSPDDRANSKNSVNSGTTKASNIFSNYRGGYKGYHGSLMVSKSNMRESFYEQNMNSRSSLITASDFGPDNWSFYLSQSSWKAFEKPLKSP